MRDLLLQCSGLAAIAVAIIHGVLGETKVFARATIEPRRLRNLIRLCWQVGTVGWICGTEHVREVIPFPRMIYRVYP